MEEMEKDERTQDSRSSCIGEVKKRREGERGLGRKKEH